MNCSCMEKNHIMETIEKFYLCTNLPLQAFSFDGTLIHAVGYRLSSQEIFDSSNIYERAKDELLKSRDNRDVVLSSHKNICFTARSICPKSSNKGIIIIGPFSTALDNSMGLAYKPACCLPHLMTLLNNIAADSPFIRQKKAMAEIPRSLYVKKALDMIDSRYSEEITLSGMASLLNINKCYLAAIFKKETGKTFIQYLNETRVDRSKPLLLQSKTSILEVAIAVGYNNQNYYNMIFKKLTSKTPLEYKNSSFLA